MKKLWSYGTSTPIQRVGVIILGVGLISLFSWMFKERLSFDDLLESYYWPKSRDSFFFHLFVYFIPIGFLMSWGYQVLVKIKEWVFNEKPKEIRQVSEPKQKQSYTPHQKNLHFKNNPAAFEYASQNYGVILNRGVMNLGLVQDVFKTSDGHNGFLIQLADKGKTTLVCGFNDKYEDIISKGNLVYWGFVESESSNRKISATGHVLATLHPELNPNSGKWTIKKDLTK